MSARWGMLRKQSSSFKAPDSPSSQSGSNVSLKRKPVTVAVPEGYDKNALRKEIFGERKKLNKPGHLPSNFEEQASRNIARNNVSTGEDMAVLRKLRMAKSACSAFGPKGGASNAPMSPGNGGGTEGTESEPAAPRRQGYKQELQSFNIDQSKELATSYLQAAIGKGNISGTPPPSFYRFLKSDLFNRFMTSGVAYFCAYFEASDAMPTAVREDLLAVDSVNKALRSFGSTYGSVLMAHSERLHSQTRQERLFFESLYNFIKIVLFTVFDQALWTPIEIELGEIFRSSQFNIQKLEDERRQKTLSRSGISSHDMYVIKHEKEPDQAQRFLNSLDPKVPRLRLTKAVRTKSAGIESVCLSAPSRSQTVPKPRSASRTGGENDLRLVSKHTHTLGSVSVRTPRSWQTPSSVKTDRQPNLKLHVGKAIMGMGSQSARHTPASTYREYASMRPSSGLQRSLSMAKIHTQQLIQKRAHTPQVKVATVAAE